MKGWPGLGKLGKLSLSRTEFVEGRARSVIACRAKELIRYGPAIPRAIRTEGQNKMNGTRIRYFAKVERS